MTTGERLIAFNAVGVAGFVLQAVLLWLLVRFGHLSYVVATALAVEITIVHNFICHWCWTWSDRASGGRAFVVRLIRFNVTNGAVSLVVNVVLMALLQGALGIPYLLANLVGVACAAAANFVLGDRVVFRVGGRSGVRSGTARFVPFRRGQTPGRRDKRGSSRPDPRRAGQMGQF